MKYRCVDLSTSGANDILNIVAVSPFKLSDNSVVGETASCAYDVLCGMLKCGWGVVLISYLNMPRETGL